MNSKLAVPLLLAGFLLSGLVSTPAAVTPAQSSIPYVPTRHDAVRDLLWLADVGTNDVVYDLGSGDGRIVIAAVRDFHARRAVGIELDPQLIRQSRENAAKAGVADRVEFIQGDLFASDVSAASVVVLYLNREADIDLRARLVNTLKPGSRVVAHQFGMGEWTPDKEMSVRTAVLGMHSEMLNPFTANPDVPEFGANGRFFGHDYLSVWIVPAPVAGLWRGKFWLDGKDRELTLTLHQRLSRVYADYEYTGETDSQGYCNADLWGDHLRGVDTVTGLAFDVHVAGDTLAGALSVYVDHQPHEVQWTAKRERVDYTGTWQWNGPKDSPVQLTIEKHDRQLTATYSDRNRDVLQINDFYDCGGGFYFTLLLGLEGTDFHTATTRKMGPDYGWLIGEGIITNKTLGGTISFYPYTNTDWMLPTNLRPAVPAAPPIVSGPRPWNPKRIAQ